MKRREMQVLICKLLEVQSLQGTAYMFKAQQILELIEKEGMLPPEIIVEEPDNDSGCIEEDSHSFVRNEWEFENETK